MLFDKKGKLFGKISIIDILIVAVILAGAAGLALKFTKSKAITPFTKPDTIQLTYYLESIENTIANQVKEGFTVKDKAYGSNMGVVKEVVKDKSVVYGFNDDGQCIASEKPGYSSLRIITEGKGVFNDNNTATINNIDYFINRYAEFVVGNTTLWIKIVDITEIKE